MRVRVIGESLVDVVIDEHGARRHPGGSPMNVAYGLGRLGVETELVTWLGDDDDGRMIVAHLRNAGVTIHPSSFGPEATSSATARVRADGGAEYDFDIGWTFTATGVVPAAWTHIGSIGAALPSGADELEAALPGLRGDGILSYDPNIRPTLMPPHGLSLARFERLAGQCDVVKMSDEDAAWLYPGRTVDAVLDRLLESGCRVAAVTAGADGMRLACPVARVTIAARAGRVVDTIGAGDSVMSALIALLLDEGLELGAERLTRAGTVATAAAAITVSRAGALPPTVEELRDALAD